MAVSLGGTLAYLTDTDADVNVMTVGRVSIQQNEQQRVEEGGEFTSELEPFKNDKMLLPYTTREGQTDVVIIGEHEVPLDDEYNNYIDKIVSVTNTSNTDVWVRTLVAMPTGGSEWETTPAKANDCWLHWNYPSEADQNDKEWGDYWKLNSTPVATIKIDNVSYYVWEFTHQVPVAPNETTFPVIRGLFMDKRVDTNDAGEYYIKYENGTEKLIKDFTDSYGKVNMLVMSQAVQAAGFATVEAAMKEAFPYGDGSANVATWFGGIVNDYPTGGNNPPVIAKKWATDNTELEALISQGETVIGLKAGTYHMPASAKGKTLTLIGESKDTSVIEVVPADQGEAGGQLDYNLDGSTVTFKNLTIKTNSQLYAGFARMNGTYNDCVIQNTYNLGLKTVNEFNNCEINITNEYLRTNGASSVVFNGCTFNTDGRAILVFQDGSNHEQTVTVKDCTFNATAAAQTWDKIHVAAVSIDGTSGTYVVNLEGNNVVDSDFSGLWQIKKGNTNVTVNE